MSGILGNLLTGLIIFAAGALWARLAWSCPRCGRWVRRSQRRRSIDHDDERCLRCCDVDPVPGDYRPKLSETVTMTDEIHVEKFDADGNRID